jgi:hypothetical protein
MTKCPSRYLTSDGRVLVCLLDHRRVHKGRFTHRNAYNTTIAVMSWPDDDPCVFDATCTTCKGRKQVFVELDVPEEDGMGAVTTRPCRPCEGTGVDETIPLHLIGLGSELRDLTGSHHGTFVIARFMKSFIRDRDGFVYYPDDGGECWALVSEIGDSFEVVRAIPPAHTGGTP